MLEAKNKKSSCCSGLGVLNADKKRKYFAKELWRANNKDKKSSDPCMDALKTFPDIIIQAWNEKNMKAKGLSSFQMFFSLWRIGKELKEPNMIMFMVSGTVGVFSPELRLVRYQKNFKKNIIDYPYGWKNSVDVCGHEIAHFVQWVMGKYFPMNQVNYLYCRESYMLDEYGAQDSEEFFADACWLAVRYPTIMKKWMPETYQWFEKFFECDLEMAK